MIITILELLFFLISIKKYNEKKNILPIVFYSFLITNQYILNVGTPIIKPDDLGLAFVFVCCILGYARDSNFFSLKNDLGAKFVSVYLLFYFITALYTYFTDADYLGGIITEIRSRFAFVAYFVFRKIRTEELNKSLNFIFTFVILSCLLFVVQYFTRIELINTFVSESSVTYRMQIIPPFVSVIILFLLIYRKNNNKKWLYILLLFSVMVLSQNRTPLFTLILQIGVFIILSKNNRFKIPMIVILSFIVVIVNGIAEDREKMEQNGYRNADIITMIKSKDYVLLASQSSFMWRVAHIAERTQYLIDHPGKMLLGVGAIDEKSPKNKFDFYIGTKVNGADGIIQYQLRSGDVFWSPIIIKYGLIGLIVHLYIMIKTMLAFYRLRGNASMMVGFLFVLGAFSSSFTSAGIFDYQGMFVLTILLILYTRLNSSKKNDTKSNTLLLVRS